MPLIRPCADLRNNYSEISRICHKTKEPMYITKNGSNDLVILSDEAFENLKNKLNTNEEERIEQLISEKFDKQYKSFEEFKKDFLSKITNSLNDIQNGNYQTLEEFCKEMEETYDIKI